MGMVQTFSFFILSSTGFSMFSGYFLLEEDGSKPG